jgi:hypothetical protein
LFRPPGSISPGDHAYAGAPVQNRQPEEETVFVRGFNLPRLLGTHDRSLTEEHSFIQRMKLRGLFYPD